MGGHCGGSRAYLRGLRAAAPCTGALAGRYIHFARLALTNGRCRCPTSLYRRVPRPRQVGSGDARSPETAPVTHHGSSQGGVICSERVRDGGGWNVTPDPRRPRESVPRYGAVARGRRRPARPQGVPVDRDHAHRAEVGRIGAVPLERVRSRGGSETRAPRSGAEDVGFGDVSPRAGGSPISRRGAPVRSESARAGVSWAAAIA